jgi:hypothetical protein
VPDAIFVRRGYDLQESYKPMSAHVTDGQGTSGVLLGQGLVPFWQNASVQGLADFWDPADMKIMKDSVIDPRPVVHWHGAFSSR